jgi:thioredoxin
VDLRNAADKIAKCGKCGAPLDEQKIEDATQSNKPIIVSDATFQSEVIDNSVRPILLDCWAPWCGPCRLIGPIMEQLAAESDGRYRVAKLNVDENPGTATQFQIASIPTMLIFKDGRLVDRIVGAQPKPVIEARLLAHTK